MVINLSSFVNFSEYNNVVASNDVYLTPINFKLQITMLMSISITLAILAITAKTTF